VGTGGWTEKEGGGFRDFVKGGMRIVYRVGGGRYYVCFRWLGRIRG